MVRSATARPRRTAITRPLPTCASATTRSSTSSFVVVLGVDRARGTSARRGRSACGELEIGEGRRHLLAADQTRDQVQLLGEMRRLRSTALASLSASAFACFYP